MTHVTEAKKEVFVGFLALFKHLSPELTKGSPSVPCLPAITQHSNLICCNGKYPYNLGNPWKCFWGCNTSLHI